MTKVQEVKAAIKSLPWEDYIHLRQWFAERDWELWDAQIEADSEAGTLDFLIEEAFDEKTKGHLQEL